MKVSDFPVFNEMALDIAYTNDMIDRSFSQEDFLKKVEKMMTFFAPKEDFCRLEDWLSLLTEKERYDIVAGDQKDAEHICEHSPCSIYSYRMTNIFKNIFNMYI